MQRGLGYVVSDWAAIPQVQLYNHEKKGNTVGIFYHGISDLMSTLKQQDFLERITKAQELITYPRSYSLWQSQNLNLYVFSSKVHVLDLYTITCNKSWTIPQSCGFNKLQIFLFFSRSPTQNTYPAQRMNDTMLINLASSASQYNHRPCSKTVKNMLMFYNLNSVTFISNTFFINHFAEFIG